MDLWPGVKIAAGDGKTKQLALWLIVAVYPAKANLPQATTSPMLTHVMVRAAGAANDGRPRQASAGFQVCDPLLWVVMILR